MSQAAVTSAPAFNNLRGILYTIAGMACFSVGDMCVKLASQELPSGQVMISMGLGCVIIYGIMLRRSGESPINRAYFERSVLLRNTGEIIGSFGMFMALLYVPLSTVTAIAQIVPLLLTIAAVLFLGEVVGRHRIAAVLIGLVGSLIVIRPGMEGFDQYSLLAVVSACGMAMRDIGSRLTRPGISSLLLSFYSVFTMMVFGMFWLMFTGGAKVPTLTTSLYLVGLVIAASSGLMMVTKAVRVGEMSVVSPFRYIRLLFAVLLGVFVLDEVIDGYTIIGSLITVLAGLYIWLREKRIKPTKPL